MKRKREEGKAGLPARWKAICYRTWGSGTASFRGGSS